MYLCVLFIVISLIIAHYKALCNEGFNTLIATEAIVTRYQIL